MTKKRFIFHNPCDKNDGKLCRISYPLENSITQKDYVVVFDNGFTYEVYKEELVEVDVNE